MPLYYSASSPSVCVERKGKKLRMKREIKH